MSLGQQPDHDEIARCAYELYVSRGAEDGRDLQDWLEAERQLTKAPKRRAKKPAAPSPRRRSVKPPNGCADRQSLTERSCRQSRSAPRDFGPSQSHLPFVHSAWWTIGRRSAASPNQPGTRHSAGVDFTAARTCRDAYAPRLSRACGRPGSQGGKGGQVKGYLFCA